VNKNVTNSITMLSKLLLT